MKRSLALFVALGLLLASGVDAQQEERYDYWPFNREMVRHGQQAVMMCNGLFTSDRTLEQLFDQELAFRSSNGRLHRVILQPSRGPMETSSKISRFPGMSMRQRCRPLPIGHSGGSLLRGR